MSASREAISRIARLKDRLAREPMSIERVSLPEDRDFWVFGYGSLMWDPGFPHLEVRVGRLFGFHRRFCVYSHLYRGSDALPGLVLGLDRGGSCWGLAYRVPRPEGPDVLEYLYGREMTSGVYTPRWLRVAGADGEVSALGFVVNRDHEQYTGRLSIEATVELILQGCGQRGTCRDYLANTMRHLHGLGLSDPHLDRLLQAVDRHLPGGTAA